MLANQQDTLGEGSEDSNSKIGLGTDKSMYVLLDHCLAHKSRQQYAKYNSG